jgi:hypothetical protein
MLTVLEGDKKSRISKWKLRNGPMTNNKMAEDYKKTCVRFDDASPAELHSDDAMRIIPGHFFPSQGSPQSRESPQNSPNKIPFSDTPNLNHIHSKKRSLIKYETLEEKKGFEIQSPIPTTPSRSHARALPSKSKAPIEIMTYTPSPTASYSPNPQTEYPDLKDRNSALYIQNCQQKKNIDQITSKFSYQQGLISDL